MLIDLEWIFGIRQHEVGGRETLCADGGFDRGMNFRGGSQGKSGVRGVLRSDRGRDTSKREDPVSIGKGEEH